MTAQPEIVATIVKGVPVLMVNNITIRRIKRGQENETPQSRS